MTKQKKNKPSPQPELEIKDLKPESDPKGGNAQYKPIRFKKIMSSGTP